MRATSLPQVSVLQVVASINRDVGGPAVSVPSLASGLARAGVRATLATLDYAVHGPQLAPAGARLASLPADFVARHFRGWSPEFEQVLAAEAAQAHLVHDHGLWMFTNLYARRSAQRAGVPLVISPRGMLEPWSLGRSRARKLAAWLLFQKKNLASAALLHATSAAEADSIRALGLRTPIATIANGVEVPAASELPARGILESRFPGLAGKRWLLFLSRLHPKKGLAELIRLWAVLAPRFPDWQLVIAGPDLDGYGTTVRGLVAAAALGERTTFTGAIDGADRASAFANADVLVLPTHSENFGIVVAEALAHGTPVLTTRGAPWGELATHRCGWWVELSDPALEAALTEALGLPKDRLKEMGARGRELVAARYSWDTAAIAMKAAYDWLLARGPRPACVTG